MKGKTRVAKFNEGDKVQLWHNDFYTYLPYNGKEGMVKNGYFSRIDRQFCYIVSVEGLNDKILPESYLSKI